MDILQRALNEAVSNIPEIVLESIVSRKLEEGVTRDKATI